MLLILTEEVTPRLRYTAGVMVAGLLGVEVQFTASADEYLAFEGPKIRYGATVPVEGPFLAATGLLFESGTGLHEVPVAVAEGLPVLFPVSDPSSLLPFDPFAAAFYMLSRYEEHQPFEKDRYGRFPARSSIAWREKFLDRPVVNEWAQWLGRCLSELFPGLTVRPPAYRYTPTVDIDHAWCYRGRTLMRTLGGFGRSVLHGRIGEAAERFSVLSGMREDPYDSYDFIFGLHERYGQQPAWFILFADYGGNDNNVTLSSKRFGRLLQDLDRHGRVGIHPSLSSGKHHEKFEDEVFGLAETLGRGITLSRQHFLKLSLPSTYRSLLQLGISDDYSMGYPEQPGFRAGIAGPFPFFDLTRNSETSLTIHPVSVMDVTLKDHLRLTNRECLETAERIIGQVRQAGGEFVSLWHNESLGGRGRWEGWQELYTEMVQMASE